MENLYYPLLRTREAELVSLSNTDLENSLPVIEITKSRTTVKDRIGLIEKNIDKVLNVMKGKPFIVDFTTDKEYTNKQIELFKNKTNGFKNWCDFCLKVKDKNSNIIPCVVLLNKPDDKDLNLQINNLLENFNNVAFRIPFTSDSMIFNEKMIHLINSLINVDIKRLKKFIFLFDFGYLNPKISLETILENSKNLISDFIKNKQIEQNRCIILSSSFPQSVTIYSDGCRGSFPIREFELYKGLKSKIENISYGDYASIHPIAYASFGGSWVPRIDIPYNNIYNFFRYRRDDGGYEKAAANAIEFIHQNHLENDLWGVQEIVKAARGTPSKRIPSHWISVRVNLYINNVLKRFR
ncbi:MAG TPA: hypothetical protein IAD29_03655 [Candidatus Scatocola faecigallinarum]|nr:hypothetical protein [Candidatus Scatocola faecigallinarum]